jgi:two-component system OmpR family sensor kinase
MKKLSLIHKISILFFVTLAMAIAVFYFYVQYEKKEFVESLGEKYDHIANYSHQNRLPPHKIIEFAKSFELQEVQDASKLKDKTKVIFAGTAYEILLGGKDFYFHFHTPHFRIMFKDATRYKDGYAKYFISILLLSLFIFIYYLIVKNIKDNNLQLHSRQLFLRTVMHELKTPVGKGRIVSELIEDEKQKNRMVDIFDKLNFLIDEFAKMESVISKNYTQNIIKSDMKSIMFYSVEKLMLDNTDNIEFENISDKKIEVDLELFSMAVKNLIDNALKYSSDKKVIIKEMDDSLYIISKGEKLSKPFNEYFKPFHNQTDGKNHGMGLGLYIVKSILDIHSFSFLYEYKNGDNIFKILFTK